MDPAGGVFVRGCDTLRGVSRLPEGPGQIVEFMNDCLSHGISMAGNDRGGSAEICVDALTCAEAGSFEFGKV